MAILNLGLDCKPIASSNQEAQFVESKEVSVGISPGISSIPSTSWGEGKRRASNRQKTPLSAWWVPYTPVAIPVRGEEQTWKAAH